jgi:hypothetical protein
MKANLYLSARPVPLPRERTSNLEYRAVAFHRDGMPRFVGDFRVESTDEESPTAVRVFFRPPHPGNGTPVETRDLPEQPVAPDNADMFLTEEGLNALRLPESEKEPCILELPPEPASLS